MVVHGIPNCDTVKRARAWLAEHGRDHRFHDFRRDGLPGPRLDAWIATAGWEALLNRKVTTWRRLDDATRARVIDAASARTLMLAVPSVINRPVVEWDDGQITVGFDRERWPAR